MKRSGVAAKRCEGLALAFVNRDTFAGRDDANDLIARHRMEHPANVYAMPGTRPVTGMS